MNRNWTSPSKASELDPFPAGLQKTIKYRSLVTRPPDFNWNRARRQSGFPTFISCQRQDANVLPKRRQSHQGDKLCDVSTVPLVARGPVFLARGSDADGEPQSWSTVDKRPSLSRPPHNWPCRRSAGESGHPSFPPSATVPCDETLSTGMFGRMTNSFLIDSYDPPGIPRKPNLVSFSKLNPCPSNRCQKGTILVHLLWVFSDFSADCAGKERYLLWHADGSRCPCSIDDSTADVTRSQHTSTYEIQRSIPRKDLWNGSARSQVPCADVYLLLWGEQRSKSAGCGVWWRWHTKEKVFVITVAEQITRSQIMGTTGEKTEPRGSRPRGKWGKKWRAAKVALETKSPEKDWHQNKIHNGTVRKRLWYLCLW